MKKKYTHAKILADGIKIFFNKTNQNSDLKMKQNLKNLSAKSKGWLSRRSAVKIEQTLNIYFEEQRKRRDAAKYKPTPPSFVTIAFPQNTLSLDNERKVTADFRKMLKRWKAETNANYLWKKEKTSPSGTDRKTHYHLIVSHAADLLVNYFCVYTAVAREFCSVEPVNLDDFKKLSGYMAKEVDFWQDGQLFGMDNEFQKFSPEVREVGENETPQYAHVISEKSGRYLVTKE